MNKINQCSPSGSIAKRVKTNAFFSVSKFLILSVSALIFSGGFFTPGLAMASSDITASVIPAEVDVNQTTNFNFSVSSSADPIVQVEIDYASAGFTLTAPITCESGWSDSSIPGKAICSTPTSGASASIGLSLNSTSPLSNGEKIFPIAVTTYTIGYNTYTTVNTTVTVQTLSASAIVSPTVSNTNQTRDYTFSFTNNGEDTISQIWASIADFTVNSCSFGGWTCAPSGNSFTLSGGSLSNEPA